MTALPPATTTDDIVQFIHDTYTSLKYSPQSNKFTILASIVLQSTVDLKVISLATGTKCLPIEKFSEKGESLHDSHAEVLARRSGLRWFMEEVIRCCRTGHASQWLEKSPHAAGPPFKLKSEVRVVMYVSALPCGDASTLHLATYQPEDMALLKSLSPPPAALSASGQLMRGRNNYGLYGVLRTKPGRPDSQMTLAMSCSDKIARWNTLGLLGALGSSLIEPIYLSEIIIGDVEDKDVWPRVKAECERAFWRRLEGISGLPETYELRKSNISFTTKTFIHSRTIFGKESTVGSSNESFYYYADSSMSPRPFEVLVNGIRRNVTAKQRMQEKYRPKLCKLSMFKVYLDALSVLKYCDCPHEIYYDAKVSNVQYQKAKSILIGDNGPFHGWVKTESEYERFGVD